jgi:hypothetical protein
MKWLVALLAIAVACYAAFKMTFPTYTYRYRLQITLSVEGQIHTGSSVIEVQFDCGPHITGLGRCTSRLRGQAALIDLGARGIVAATLRTGDTISPVPDRAVDAVWLCANAFGNRSTIEELPDLPRLRGRRNLSPDNFPRLVWFPNPSDPKSVRKITIDDVSAVIDPTAHFTEAYVEITKDPVKIDLPSKLPWYFALEREQKGRGFLSMPGVFQLSYIMFVGELS